MMRDDNVLVFDPLVRGGMARRGAPDKNVGYTGEPALECPSCFMVLRPEADWLADEAAIVCERCGSEISLTPARRGSGAG
jgi:hypothetical protein